jgi:DNA-binding transcriptional ArsR family regulator
MQRYLCTMSSDEGAGDGETGHGEPAEKEPRPSREIDLDSLKGLAHPLRVEILDTLGVYGPFTASGLADRLGESSGATSYHLRQLERHGFVREIEGRGTGRERWWERTPGSLSFTPRDMQVTPGGRAASALVMREWNRSRDQLLTAFSEHGSDVLPREWTDVAELWTINLRLTSEQLGELTEAFAVFAQEHIERYRGQDLPGSRPVQVHFNAFPVIDGEETRPE